ncbi:MAG: hypothetical protein PF436_02015 [Prolixibacteraceae bacterium]|jgi:sialate O-acetylesterase|nr:hypothetical protein [Prolixibacteraceae bacterium]
MNNRLLLSSVFVLAAFLTTNAAVKLPAIFTDNMVLQQKSSPAIWGWTEDQVTVKVTTSWNNKSYETKSDKNGNWKLEVSTPEAGGPFTIAISDGEIVTLNNVMLGEVWLCSGQSNMEMPMKGFTGQPVSGSNMAILKSKNPNIRMISVPRKTDVEPQTNFEGNWKEASPETVAEFSATGYYFGRLVNEMIDVPIGLIDVSYGGSCIQAWMSRETSVPFEDKGLPVSNDDFNKEQNRVPTGLFNGMLNPVIGYGIKGCIWYQGETNYREPDLYEELFPKMVSNWRTLWGVGELPFYYCQIAPFNYAQFTPYDLKEKDNSAYLRDAQRKSAQIIPNAAMAVLMDCADCENIHPADKHIAGERLALLALAKTYELKGFGYASPEFNAMEIIGSTVTVSFNNVPNGITSFGEEITSFEIAGADQRFYPAKVFKRNKSVVLSSPHVKEPVAVRYAFKDCVKGQLFSTEGLPLSSFRTDDW